MHGRAPLLALALAGLAAGAALANDSTAEKAAGANARQTATNKAAWRMS